MKKMYKYFIAFLLFFVFSVNVNAATLTTQQQALKEVLDAYYNKGNNIQYDSYKKGFKYKPEAATEQNLQYSVCSSFVYAVYYNTFGIKLLDITTKNALYANTHKEQEDVVLSLYDTEYSSLVSTDEKIKTFVLSLIKDYKLQIGDIINYSQITSGHEVIVYDIEYDSDGNPTDVLIINSTSNFETDTTKLSQGVSFNNTLNTLTGKNEGSVKIMKLSKLLTYTHSMKYFAVLRPLLKDSNDNYTGKYYEPSCTESNGDYTCTSNLSDYSLTDYAKNRLNYKGIDISKTVDKFNNNSVNIGDELTYTIKIKNNSDSSYSNIPITETISKYVDILDKSGATLSNNQLNWVVTVNPNETYTVNYKVRVKDNTLNETIVSTGTVGNIESATIKNYITKNTLN